jgi:HEAT repeat protein
MTDYLETIASIGNLDARMAELVRRATSEPQGNRLLLCGLADGWAPLRMRAAGLLADQLDPDSETILADYLLGERIEDRPMTWTDARALDVRRMAPLALRTHPLDDRTVAALHACLTDRDEVVRYHAMLAAYAAFDEGDLRDAVGLALSDDDPAVLVVGAQIAAHHGWRDLVPRLLERRAGLSWDDRMHLTLALSEFPEALDAATLQEVVDDLLAGLEDAQMFAASAQALGRLAPPRALEPLRRAASRIFSHPLLKVEAMAALAKMGDEWGVEQIGKTLHARRRDTRGYAMQLVGALQLEQFRAELMRVAKSDDWHADTAALALGHFDDSATRDVLREVAEGHAAAEVREAALEALELQRARSFTGEVV